MLVCPGGGPDAPASAVGAREENGREAMDSSDLIAVVARYLEALERFDLEAVADCFTDDLFYSHPAYAHDRDGGPPRHEVRGRQALIALLEQRGRVQVDHEVHSAALQGADGFVAGTFASGSRRG